MNDIKTEEERIICLFRSGDKRIAIAINKTYARFAKEDEQCGGCKGKLFFLIYFRRNKGVPILQLCAMSYIQGRTIYRYRNEYLGWIKYYFIKICDVA